MPIQHLRSRALEEDRALLAAKKIILLDRDGVINEKADKGEYINCMDEFRWIETTLNSLRQLSKMGFSFIVISNQAGIARGITSAEEIKHINQQMVLSLAEEGIEILQVYVCPHHWEDNVIVANQNLECCFKHPEIICSA